MKVIRGWKEIKGYWKEVKALQIGYEVIKEV